MPKQIRMTFVNEGVSAVADLLEEAARRTCAALWEALPAAGPAHHACYSGSECVFRLPEFSGYAGERDSEVTPGDVGVHLVRRRRRLRGEEDFAEICWFYDRDAVPSMPGRARLP